jgi:hypothetical protein
MTPLVHPLHELPEARKQDGLTVHASKPRVEVAHHGDPAARSQGGGGLTLSPPTSEGPTFAGITGTQGPTR